MADNLNRKINIWINDKQVVNSYKGITSSIRKARNELANMTIGSKDYINQTKKIKQLSGVLDKHRMAQGGILRGWKKIRNEIKQIAIGNTIANLFTGALSQVGQAFNFITSSVGEAEQGLTNVLTLMSDADIAKYGDSLAEGTLEIMKLGNAQKDTNKALFDAVSAGVDAGKSIEFLADANVLAKGGVTTLGVAVDGTTTLVNAYNLSLDESSNVMDAYFSAQKKGKTTVEELATSIGKVAPIASNVGVKYQELLSASAKLTKGGISTSESMTYLKAALGNLMKPGTAAAKILKKFNVPMGASQLKTVGFTETISRLNKVIKHSPDLLAKMIPSIEGQNAILALTGKNFEDYQSILNDVTQDVGKNSSLQKAYAMQMETLPNILAKAKGELTALAVTVGKKLAPVIKAIVPLFTGFMKRIIQFIDFIAVNSGVFKTLIKLVSIATVAFISYKTAVKLSVLWTNKMKIATLKNIVVQKSMLIITRARRIATLAMATAQAFLTGNTIKAAKAYKLLGMAMKANPLGVIIGAIGAITAAYVIFGKSMDKAAVKLRMMNDLNVIAKKSIIGQKVELEKLVIAAKDDTKSKEERQKAIEAINKLSPEYLGNITLETIGTKEATAAMDMYLKSLEKKAKLQAANEKLVEIEKQLFEVEDRLSKVKPSKFNAIQNAYYLSLTGRTKELNQQKKILLGFMKEEHGLVKKAPATATTQDADIVTQGRVVGGTGAGSKQKELDLYAKYIESKRKLDKELSDMRKLARLENKSALDKELAKIGEHYTDMMDVTSVAIAELEKKLATKQGLNNNELKLLNQFGQQQIDITKWYEAEKTKVSKKHEDLRIAEKEKFQDKIATMQMDDEDKELQAVTRKYESLIAKAKKFGIDTVELYQMMNEALDEVKVKYAGDGEVTDVFGMTDADWEKFQEHFSNAMQYVGLMQDAMGSFSAIRDNNEEKAMAEYEANMQNKMDLAKDKYDKGLISEKNYNLRVGYMEAALDKKRKKMEYDKAVRDKQSRIFTAVIDTAAAVVEALPNIPLSVAVGIAGGIGIAAIASEPLPAYGDGGRINSPHIAVVGEKGKEIMMSNKMLTDSTYGPIVEDLARVQEGKKPKFLNQPGRANFEGMSNAVSDGSSNLINNNTVVNQVDSKGMEQMTNQMQSVTSSMNEVTKTIKDLKYLKAVISQREMDERDTDDELLKRYSNF